MEVSDIVTINVGGNIREISRNTLIKSPLFEALFNEDENLDNFFIDRSAELFDAVLAYLAWEIPLTNPEELNELAHYAISESDCTSAEKLSSELAEQILSSNKDLDGEFYISGCGKLFVTTRRRLTKIRYFHGVFNESVMMKKLYKGTRDDPYRTEVPAKELENILKHLRDNRNTLLRTSMKILEILGGLSEDDSLRVTESLHAHIIERAKPRSGSGALMDLVAVGAQNRDFDGDENTKIITTMWKKNFPQTAKCATNRISLDTRGERLFYSAKIPRDGDLMTQAYIRFESIINGKRCRVDTDDPLFFYKAIDQISLYVGHLHIATLTGDQMMLLEGMRIDQTFDGVAMIRLPMFFCAETTNAFPIFLLKYEEIRFDIKMFEVLPNIEIIPEFLVTLVYLSTNERKWFQETPLNYSIVLHKSPMVFTTKVKDQNIFNCNLNLLSALTNGIYFTLHKDDSIESMFMPQVGCLASYELTLNEHVRSAGDEDICLLNKIDSKINKMSPVYVIAFAQEPMNMGQYSRTLNLSRIDRANLVIKINSLQEVGCIRVWTNYWNNLRISDNQVTLLYN